MIKQTIPGTNIRAERGCSSWCAGKGHQRCKYPSQVSQTPTGSVGSRGDPDDQIVVGVEDFEDDFL